MVIRHDLNATTFSPVLDISGKGRLYWASVMSSSASNVRLRVTIDGEIYIDIGGSGMSSSYSPYFFVGNMNFAKGYLVSSLSVPTNSYSITVPNPNQITYSGVSSYWYGAPVPDCIPFKSSLKIEVLVPSQVAYPWIIYSLDD